MNSWVGINFGSELSNPIYYASTFHLSDKNGEIEHLDLDLSEGFISNYAFYNAKNLKTIRVKAKEIGMNSFTNCGNVTDICIDVQSLSDYSFSKLSALQNIYSLKEEPPVAYDNVFSKYEGINLYVPSGAVSSYENAENCWWRFLDIYSSDFSDIDDIFNPDSNGIKEILDYSKGYFNTNVYNINGMIIKRNASIEDIELLSPGLYIIGGKKVRVK